VAGFAVRDLRAAAAEAGIPAQAFDAALAEHQRDRVSNGLAAEPAIGRALGYVRRTRTLATAAVAALLIALGVLVVFPAPATTVEQAIVLRCLAPTEAAELVRPLLRDRSSTVQYDPARAPRVLTIRGTPDVVSRVKEALAEHERGGSSTCTASPVAPMARAVH
jgi:hypothetical protein